MFKLLGSLLLLFVLGCAPQMLPPSGVATRLQVLLKQDTARLEQHGMLKQAYDMLVERAVAYAFMGFLEEEDLPGLLEADAADYYLAIAYRSLIEGDIEKFDAAVGQAKDVLIKASSALEKVEKRVELKQQPKGIGI